MAICFCFYISVFCFIFAYIYVYSFLFSYMTKINVLLQSFLYYIVYLKHILIKLILDDSV